MMQIITHTDLEILARSLIENILSKDNFCANISKGGFLTGGNVIVCESRGLREYLQKVCVDKYGIWTALPFKPLAGLLMHCAYNLSPKDQKKDEKESVFNKNNLVWAVYNLLKDSKKTFAFANEIASLFFTYQIYRSKIIEAWNKKEAYKIDGVDKNFDKNEEFQRNLWINLKEKYKNELDISQLYELFGKSEKKALPKQIFIFAPLSIAPIQLKALKDLSGAGCKVNLYLHLVSSEYTGDTKNDKSIANLRKKSWEEDKIVDENRLYWDLGNRLIANLGRSAQVLYEQIGWENLEPVNVSQSVDSLLEKIQANIINDSNEETGCGKDDSLTLNNCFSPLREVEVLHDYILGLFVENKELTPSDIAIVSPNIENYASAIEAVFGRNNILPYKIADRDINKYDKAAQLLKSLFSLTDGRYYKAPDILALFEYSMYAQDRKLDSRDGELLEKWIRENAIRYGLENSAEKPDYSFKSGFDQLAAGFFLISETGFSEKGEYCYPDIEGNSAGISDDFVCFVKYLREFDEESRKEKSIDDWDYFFRENLQTFFGSDETDFNEDKDNSYQKIIGAWDSLKKEMLIGFGSNKDMPMDFSVLKEALPEKLAANAKSSYSLSGRISCANLETLRAVPHKIICCIGMNSGEFPRQKKNRDINLMIEHQPGDKDIANEDRLMFLETICSAKEKLYISWVGQDEKTADELDPSSAVVMLLKNLEEQYLIERKDLIAKHPLQPFSKKYFDGSLETYDNRWNHENSVNHINPDSDRSVWKWKIDAAVIEEKRDIDTLYKILSDAPEYFLKIVCDMELPEDIELLCNIEPFIVENGLEEWKLANTILNKEDYYKEIKISKFRGELPSGKYADGLIKNIEKEAKELKEKAKNEKKGTFWIYPGSDKGKYRLKHWLYHLDLNCKSENIQNTKMFLKDVEPIELKGMSKEEAKNKIEKLWALADGIKEKMQPIFPDAAWEYINNTGSGKEVFPREKRLSNAWGKFKQYSPYEKMIAAGAESFKELNIEKEFIKCSEDLFEEYDNYKIEGNKNGNA